MASKQRYVEIASGHITNRGRADLLSNLPNLIGKAEDKHELYHSWYAFDKDIERHLNDKNASISSFKGSYYINEIILDLDRPKNMGEEGFLDFLRYFLSIELVEDLNIEIGHIKIWFSGTGFHVVLPNLFNFTPSVSLPQSVKSTLEDVFPDCDSIYDGSRLIRAPYSYNKKSGLFKIPLSMDEIYNLSMNEIKDRASTLPKELKVDNLLFNDFDEVKKPYLKKFLKLYAERKVNYASTKRSAFDIDPSSVVTCMQTILSKPPTPGERNDSMMRLASWMRRNGMPESIVYSTLSKWSGNDTEAQTTTESEFEKGYNYWCNDHIMSKYCDPKCIHFKRKDFSMALETAEELTRKYVNFVKKGISKKAFNFRNIYQMNHDFWVMPGELVIVLGDTGMGKSTFVSNLCVALRDKKIIFLSMENTWHLNTKRLIQMGHGYTQAETNKYCTEIDEGDSEDLNISNLYDPYDHIIFGHIPPDIIKLQEEVAYQNPDIILIDPTDELHVNNVYNEFERMNQIIIKLKEIATNQNCIVIAVHHINKESAKNGIIDIHSAKGTSTVVQKADKVLTINGEENHPQRMLYSEKNRDGGKLKLMFEFDKKLMLFNQIDPLVVPSIL